MVTSDKRSLTIEIKEVVALIVQVATNQKNNKGENMNKPKIEKPKVFISYAWTSDAYVNKIAAFASSLIDIGIEVLFDKFEMKPGNELNDFM